MGEYSGVFRTRGGDVDIEEAWVNFGYIIVNDCCEEWMEATRRIRRLEIKRGWQDLTWGEEAVLAHAKHEKKQCEKWLKSDLCYDLCGYSGEELIENLKERLRDYGVR